MSDRHLKSVTSFAARLRCHMANATNINITVVTTRRHPARALFLGSLCLCVSLMVALALAYTWLVPAKAAVAARVEARQVCGPQWKLMASPNVPNSINVLDAVSASSPSDIWAVGYSYEPSPNSLARTLAMHWDGAEWKIVSTPNPGPDSNYLDGVRTFAPNDAWAVGDSGNDRVLRDVLLHWDGNSWFPINIPALADENAAFYAIDGVSSRDLWAVGVTENGARSLAYHYDGSTWSGFDTALDPGTPSALYNVVARSANDVWAVGTMVGGGRLFDVELHWDGAHWQSLTSADPRLLTIAVGYDIAVPGPDNARFVVGTSGTGRSMQPGILHADGSTREVTGGSFRVADYNALTGVVALSRTEAWAVGYGIPGGESAKNGQHRVPLVLHTSNGTDWFGEQTVPIEGNYSLVDIIVVPTTHNMVAVGTANGTTLIERYADPCAAAQPTPTSPVAPTRIAATPTPTAVPTYPPTPIPGQDQNSITFPETGKTVKGIFLDYWNKNGGLPQQGYPISEMFTEISPLNKQPYTVQYFERAVFEYHPENQPPYNVLLSQLGTFQYKERYGAQGAPGQQANTSEGSQLFAETGKHVGGKFLEYWKSHGGLAQQGYPISEEFVEKSPLDGKEYRVQYFERAVFELHPENQPPYDVLLSQLGTFQYKAMYPGNK